MEYRMRMKFPKEDTWWWVKAVDWREGGKRELWGVRTKQEASVLTDEQILAAIKTIEVEGKTAMEFEVFPADDSQLVKRKPTIIDF